MRKSFKKIVKVIAAVFCTVVILLCAYLGWLTVSDYQPLYKENLVIAHMTDKENVELDKKYSITTYNIGFGAYSQDFDFFMDGGTESKAKDRETVMKNINGAVDELNKIDPDFAFVQEIDINSSRSRKTDQRALVAHGLDDEYTNCFAFNYKVPYIIYPFDDMHGKVSAGQGTYSKYKFETAERISLPIDQSWLARLFGLDRCMIVNRIKTSNNKELVLINLHMSAYDKGGEYRQKQLNMLEEILEDEYKKGNYVIAGGDWNHVIPTTDINKFAKTEERPDWYDYIPENFSPKGYRFEVDENVPTNRTAGIPYDKDVNFTAIIDGFIVSDNINVVAKNGSDLQFKYSDHNPTTIEFKLN